MNRLFIDSRSLDDLLPEVRSQIQTLLTNMRTKHSLEFRPFFTYRGPGTQARLWCQSRTPEEVEATIRRRSIPEPIARLLRQQPTLSGKWATNALPGHSAHQWQVAVDLMHILPSGQANWSNKWQGIAPYSLLANEAVLCGLQSLGPTLRDWVHIQTPSWTPPSSWDPILAKFFPQG
jgi:hypothetical protein